MDVQILSNLITNAGFSIGVAVYLLLDQKRKDKENKEYVDNQISDLQKRLEDSENEGKKDKAMFSEALNSFNKALEKFEGIEDMKKDISTVVQKVDNVENQMNKMEDKVDDLLSQNIKNN